MKIILFEKENCKNIISQDANTTLFFLIHSQNPGLLHFVLGSVLIDHLVYSVVTFRGI